MMQIMRDPDSGNSRGFGFISYDSFEASDSAIEVSLETGYTSWPASFFSEGSVALEKQVVPGSQGSSLELYRQ